MSMKLEQAARQALEALEESQGFRDGLNKAITALREALEQRIKVTAAEVVAYRDMHCVTMAEAKKRVQEMKTEQAGQSQLADASLEPVKCVKCNAEVPLYKNGMCEVCDFNSKQAEQEPVAWRWPTHNGYAYAETHFDDEGGEPLYAAPVRTKDLTDDEIDALIDEACDSQMPYDMFARAVIAADREKNK